MVIIGRPVLYRQAFSGRRAVSRLGDSIFCTGFWTSTAGPAGVPSTVWHSFTLELGCSQEAQTTASLLAFCAALEVRHASILVCGEGSDAGEYRVSI